jgi:hypothetical protein
MTPFRAARRSSPVLLLVLGLVVAACGSPILSVAPVPSPAPTPAPSGSPSASVPAPTSPAPASPSGGPSGSPVAICDPGPNPSASPTILGPDDPNAARYAEIEAQVGELRGLRSTAPVERAVFDEAGLCAYITAAFAKDNPEALVGSTEKVLKALLLMPEDASLEDLYLEMLSSQVAGLYDDETKRMYVVSETGEIGPTEEITYAHEFTHALQDQAFRLRDLVGEATDQGDRTLARTTLVEGDATLAMYLWAQQHLTPLELVEVAGAADPASQEVLDRLPAILRETLMFPYLTGLTVALAAYGSGGYAAVDALYADPPDSTEQILHADKLASREAPVTIAIPDDLAARIGDGWTVPFQDTLGEFQLSILLREVSGVTAPLDAAAGWGGDRVALVEGPAGQTGVVLDTAWDTPADADEFATAAEGLVAALKRAGRSAGVYRPAPDRVVLVTAESDDTAGRLANALGLAG